MFDYLGFDTIPSTMVTTLLIATIVFISLMLVRNLKDGKVIAWIMYSLFLVLVVTIAFLVLLILMVICIALVKSPGQLYLMMVAVTTISTFFMYKMVNKGFEKVAKKLYQEKFETIPEKLAILIQPEISKIASYGVLLSVYIINKSNTFNEATMNMKCEIVDGMMQCAVKYEPLDVFMEAYLTFVIIDTIFTIFKLYVTKIKNGETK